MRRVCSETKRDAKLEAAIRSIYERSAGDEEVRYYYNKVDLNGDGKPEALVYFFGEGECVTGGCGLEVFQLINGEYKLVADISLVWNPVIVSQHKTHGWNDLILFVVGGGIQPGYYATLRFNGKTYPENPTVKPAEPLKIRAKGTAYLVGSRAPNSGFAVNKK